MIVTPGDANKARDIVRWLHDNHAPNRLENLRPTYGSYLNQEVLWQSRKEEWKVRHKRNSDGQRIEIMVEDRQVLMEVALRFL